MPDISAPRDWLTAAERALLERAQRFRRDYLAPRAAHWERAREAARGGVAWPFA